jgi:putative oxidoreductase
MNAGRLIARVVIGGAFVGHGTQKLFGWFGGAGPEGTEAMMEKLELRPARRNALASGLSETVGGTLLAFGALTPLAGALLSASMFTAIRKVHFQRGFWNTAGGYEYNAVLIAAIAGLIDSGPGSPSVDRALGLETNGPVWALAGIAAGAVGSELVIEAGQQPPVVEPEVERPEQQQESARTAA